MLRSQGRAAKVPARIVYSFLTYAAHFAPRDPPRSRRIATPACRTSRRVPGVALPAGESARVSNAERFFSLAAGRGEPAEGDGGARRPCRRHSGGPPINRSLREGRGWSYRVIRVFGSKKPLGVRGTPENLPACSPSWPIERSAVGTVGGHFPKDSRAKSLHRRHE